VIPLPFSVLFLQYHLHFSTILTAEHGDITDRPPNDEGSEWIYGATQRVNLRWSRRWQLSYSCLHRPESTHGYEEEEKVRLMF
jgi:hypothetical protein